jgi:hypothetical protein
MEWLNAAISAPGAGFMVVPLLLAVLWAFNPPETAPARKGWHPVTKVCLWTFGAFLVFTGCIALAKSLGWL